MKMSFTFVHFLITGCLLITTCSTLMAQDLFIEHTVDNSFNGACSVCSYDLDGDGNLDVLAAANTANQIAWWKSENDTEITFTKNVVDANAIGIIYVDATDIDADNDLDILGASWQGNEVAIWFNDGEDPISWEKIVVDANITRAHEVHGAYVDADTLIDIIAASGGDHQIIWYRNTGSDPIVWEKNIVDNQFTGARSVACIDIDRDGYNDLVGAALNANQISVWFNSGTNPVQWTKQIVTNNFTGAHWVYITDLDKDDDMDILGAAYSISQIAWWENDGDNPIQWNKQIIASGFTGALSVAAADLDLDNDIDVFGAATIANKVNWWENDGNMPIQWTSNDALNNYYEAWPVFGIDFDNDGDTDVLTAAATARKVTWLENTTIITSIDNESYDNPQNLNLFQNYPNPFNPNTTIAYNLEGDSQVVLKIYNSLGQEVKTLVNDFQIEGYKTVEWNGTDNNENLLSSGVYVYRIKTDNKFKGTQNRKMVLLK